MEPSWNNEDEAQQDIENEEPSSCSHRQRSNTQVDSIGFRKYAAFVRKRSKSVSVADYCVSSMQYQHEMITDDMCASGTSGSNQNKLDTFDSKPDARSIEVPPQPSPKEPSVSTVSTAFMPVSMDADRYNMNHKNRGKCIIFNHETFVYDVEVREGSSYDVDRLKKTFGKLGFDIEYHYNLPHSEVMAEIGKVSQLDHTDNDCVCIIVLTHGLQNDMITASDGVAYTSDKLWKPFTADKCKTLAGKPKLFFIQACRGEKTDQGVLLQSRTAIDRELTETDSFGVNYIIPTHADFLLAHSTAEGFYAWRNPLEGTWYIQCLCNVLNEYGTKMDLMNMLTITARKIALDYSSIHVDENFNKKRQVPSVTTMLLRSVYFPPKSEENKN